MSNCAACGNPVKSGIVMHKECFDLLQKTQQLDNKPLTTEEPRKMTGEAVNNDPSWLMKNLNEFVPPPMTNGDRLRSMSDEELAEMLAITSPFTCIKCEEFVKDWCDTKCSEHCLKWLKQPAEVE